MSNVHPIRSKITKKDLEIFATYDPLVRRFRYKYTVPAHHHTKGDLIESGGIRNGKIRINICNLKIDNDDLIVLWETGVLPAPKKPAPPRKTKMPTTADYTTEWISPEERAKQEFLLACDTVIVNDEDAVRLMRNVAAHSIKCRTAIITVAKELQEAPVVVKSKPNSKIKNGFFAGHGDKEPA